MKITKEIDKKLRSFDFSYAEHVDGNVYKILRAEDLFDSPGEPHLITPERMCFWDNECVDHPKCISLKNVLIF